MEQPWKPTPEQSETGFGNVWRQLRERDRTIARYAALHSMSVLGLSSRAAPTCIDATRDELRTIARDYWNNGIRHIAALRGDLPPDSGKPRCTPPIWLVCSKEVADFDISVAAYPECAPSGSEKRAGRSA